MCLDFCSAVIIPGCVVYPYVLTYDISLGSFPKVFVYDDGWFAASLFEIRQSRTACLRSVYHDMTVDSVHCVTLSSRSGGSPCWGFICKRIHMLQRRK